MFKIFLRFACHFTQWLDRSRTQLCNNLCSFQENTPVYYKFYYVCLFYLPFTSECTDCQLQNNWNSFFGKTSEDNGILFSHAWKELIQGATVGVMTVLLAECQRNCCTICGRGKGCVLLQNWVLGFLSSRVKQPRHETDHYIQFNAKVNKWNFSPLCLLGMHKDMLPCLVQVSGKGCNNI